MFFMAAKAAPTRKGIARHLTLEVEASKCLREDAPSVKSQGFYVSRLVLAERARREERARLKQAVLKALEDVDD